MPRPSGIRRQFLVAHMEAGLQRVPASPVAIGSGRLIRPLRRTTPFPQCQGNHLGGGSASVRSKHPEGDASTSRMIAGFARRRAVPSSDSQVCR